MEKYFIITPESPVHKEYLEYKEMSEKVNAAFKEFAKENGIETHEYYQYTQYLEICPTESDTEKFGRYFKKDAPGLFKKNSPFAKAWVEKCQELELKTPHKPMLGFEFNTFRRSRSRLFMIDDTLYGSLQADGDFELPKTGYKEMKASEFFKIVEDYEESLKQ